MDPNQFLILTITLFLMFVGLIFTVIPPLPGTLIIWSGMMFYAWAWGLEQLGWLTIILLTLLMFIGITVDIVAGHYGARLGGASWQAIVIGFVLGLVFAIGASFIGTPILGCIAAPVGMVIGITWIEWRKDGDWVRTRRALTGYFAGQTVGIMARFGAGVLMIVTFAGRIYFWG